MYKRSVVLSLFLPAALLLSQSVSAAPTTGQWQALNVQLSQQHVLPRYQALASSSEQLKLATASLCQHPGEAQLNASRSAFHQTMDAWQGIQHIQFGPVEFLMRNFSLQFWPDKKNLTSKQLNALLSAKDESSLKADYFRGASIAVKGLPALERLLFSDKPLSPYGCQLTYAIATNVSLMSHEIAQEWESQQLPRIDSAPDGSDYYEDSIEASTELMKALVEPVEVIRDLKLLRPLHKSAQKAKPRRSESWRSERSLRNVRINLAALAELYRGSDTSNVKALLQAEGQGALAQTIDSHFRELDQRLAAIDKPLFNAVKDAKGHQQLRDIATQMKALHSELEQAMQVLEIQLGFNSRDGD